MVSIILAVYNGEKYLSEQIESLLCQSYSNIEVVVMDDVSRDRSVGIVQEWSTKDSRIRLIRNESNVGLVANFLKGCGHVNGEFVAFCDQDDVWSQDKVEKLVALLKKDPQNTLVYSDLSLEKKGVSSFWKVSSIRPRRGFLKDISALKNLSPGCAMLFLREVADRLDQIYRDNDRNSFWKPTRLDDSFFMHDHLAFTVAAFMGRIDYTTERLMQYRQHADNSIGAHYQGDTRQSHRTESLRKRIVFLKKNSIIQNPLDLKCLEGFVAFLEYPNNGNGLRWLPYFLALRGAGIRDQALGILQSVFPSIYDYLKKKSK